MFIGEHRHNLDEKGRLQVPSSWRAKLAEGAVVTKGFAGSLKLYPLVQWQQIAARLAELPQSDPNARAYVRQTLAGAMDVELDKLGRCVLPAYLRQYANLTKATVLAGLHDHIELWDATSWDAYVAGADASSEARSEALQTYGI